MKWVGLIIVLIISAFYFTSRGSQPLPEEIPSAVSTSEVRAIDQSVVESKSNAKQASSPLPAPVPVASNSETARARPTSYEEVKQLPEKLKADSQGILRDADGNPLRTYRKVAEKACADRGMRLPTIRELVSWGGKIVTAAEADAPVPLGYSKELIHSINPGGKPDEFYFLYNSSGKSMRPAGELDGEFLPSSSINAKNTGEYLAFDVETGGINSGEAEDPDPRYHVFAVRCVAR